MRLAVKLPLVLAVRRAVGLAMGLALDMLTHTTISFYTFINSSMKEKLDEERWHGEGIEYVR